MEKKTYAIKACTGKGYRNRSSIVIGFLIAASILSVVLLVIGLIRGWMYAGGFLIPLVLALTYIVIRVNIVYPTYLASDKKNIYMKNWVNDFLPYAMDFKIKFLREFIPAQTKITKIPIEDIDSVIIGTKNFIKRNGKNNESFIARLDALGIEKKGDYYLKKTVQNMDLIYISTLDGECYYMPLVKFSPRDVSRVLQFIQRSNPEAEIKVSSKDFRTSLRK